MDAPNLSSNVVASSIAIRFGCKAPSLTVCSGATSGAEALHWAANAIRAGRARRMVVAGVEPADPAAILLMRESASARIGASAGLRLIDACGALILEASGAAAERSARPYARVGRYGYYPGQDLAQSIVAATGGDATPPDLWVTPNQSYAETAGEVRRVLGLWGDGRPHCIDLGGALGETYGALGVLQCVVACLWLKDHASRTAIATAGASWGDGSASLLIHGMGESGVGLGKTPP
jgi:3-oxoacyl-[acyl-carrier-protein] synthase II